MARTVTSEVMKTREEAADELKHAASPLDVHRCLTKLFSTCERPNHAEKLFFRVCSLANHKGIFGPLVAIGGEEIPVREALARLLRQENLYKRRDGHKRKEVYAEVVREMVAGGEEIAEDVVSLRVSEKLEELSLQSLKRNISTTMRELDNAGLIKRHYGGKWSDNPNRGGGRHAVYKIAPWAIEVVQGSEIMRQSKLV